MHFAFMIKDPFVRDNILRLLIKEEIGDLNKRNTLGYLPHEISHDQPLMNLSKDL
jgi:hypothetical protein